MPRSVPVVVRTQVYGHRGSRRPGPENTAAGVRAALRAGADGVEVDVRRDGSGALVVSHDPVQGPAQALAAVLDAVLFTAGPGAAREGSLAARVVLEVKNRPGDPDFDDSVAATARALVGLLAARGGHDNAVISSFDEHSLNLVRALGGAPSALLTPPGVALRVGTANAVQHGHVELHPHWASVTARGVGRAHAAGLRVVPWTVVSVARARRLAALGVDALICDDPGALVGTLAGGLAACGWVTDDDP